MVTYSKLFHATGYKRYIAGKVFEQVAVDIPGLYCAGKGRAEWRVKKKQIWFHIYPESPFFFKENETTIYSLWRVTDKYGNNFYYMCL